MQLSSLPARAALEPVPPWKPNQGGRGVAAWRPLVARAPRTGRWRPRLQCLALRLPSLILSCPYPDQMNTQDRKTTTHCGKGDPLVWPLLRLGHLDDFILSKGQGCVGQSSCQPTLTEHFPHSEDACLFVKSILTALGVTVSVPTSQKRHLRWGELNRAREWWAGPTPCGLLHIHAPAMARCHAERTERPGLGS